MKPWLALTVLFVLLAGPSSAEEARLLLRWNAPHGQPGATEELSAAIDKVRISLFSFLDLFLLKPHAKNSHSFWQRIVFYHFPI